MAELYVVVIHFMIIKRMQAQYSRTCEEFMSLLSTFMSTRRMQAKYLKTCEEFISLLTIYMSIRRMQVKYSRTYEEFYVFFIHFTSIWEWRPNIPGKMKKKTLNEIQRFKEKIGLPKRQHHTNFILHKIVIIVGSHC